jgi:hypothetical protein
MLPWRRHSTELPAGITLIEPATGGLSNLTPSYRTCSLSAGRIVRTSPCRDTGGQTKFTADGTLTVTHRLQCFPFPPATRCRRGEWDKLLRCLISLENIFVLSIRRHKPCQPKACDHRHHLFRVYCPNGQPFLLPTRNVLIAQTSDRQSSTSACSPTSVAAAACHGHGSSHHQPVQRTGKLATTVGDYCIDLHLPVRKTRTM